MAAAALSGRRSRAFTWEPLFDLILVEGELGFGKPDERIYRAGAHDACGRTA